MAPNSAFNTVQFEPEFRTRLLAQHCFVGTPLFQDSFDAAFTAACLQSGHEVMPAPTGRRFWDVAVDGRKISLKSTKARNLRKNILHISKLTEAAWIQDCRTAALRRDRTLRLFEQYIGEVDVILQFRYFSQSQLYELVEIPVAPLFEQIMSVDKSEFAADGPTINIPHDKNPPDFTLKLDRSDSKITISNINKDVCFVHGSWRLADQTMQE